MTFSDEAILDREESSPGSSSLRWEGLGLPLWPRALPAWRQSTWCAQPALQQGVSQSGSQADSGWLPPAITTVWLLAFGFSGPVLFSVGWTVFPPWVVMRTWKITSYSSKLQADTGWACGIMVPFGQTAGSQFLLSTCCVLMPLQAFPLPSGNLDSSHLYEEEDRVMLTITHLQEWHLLTRHCSHCLQELLCLTFSIILSSFYRHGSEHRESK